MTAIKTTDIDRFIAKPDPSQPVVLVYGPDAGLVRERVDALVRASVDDPNDPFALARIEGEELSANPSPARRRSQHRAAVRRPPRRAAAGQFAPQHRSVDRSRAGSAVARLPRHHRGRRAAQNRAAARAVRKSQSRRRDACYPDNERDLARLIDEEMRAANLTLAADARAALTALHRRRPSRLAQRDPQARALCPGQGAHRARRRDGGGGGCFGTWRSTASSTRPLPARPREVETEFGKARAGGSSPAAIVSAAIRQVANLHKMKLAVDGGDSIEFAMMRGAPPVHFTREETGRSRAARLDAAASVARHGAACRSLARGAAQRGARRNDRAAHAAVDRGERAA